jgi:mannose-6-phosphate isomerase-like protein (cupin superfamily)
MIMVRGMTIMREFPEFMKNSRNHIDSKNQNTEDIDGYYYEGANGGQMAFWTCYSDQVSEKHMHEFDEYMICVSGRYVAVIDDKEYVLDPGDELFIPKGAEQWGRCVAGTRTIHAFGGKRIKS